MTGEALLRFVAAGARLQRMSIIRHSTLSRIVVATIAALALAGCSYTFNEASIDAFDVEGALFVSDNLNFVEHLGDAHIRPDVAPDFWEIRIAGADGYKTVATGGEIAFSDLPAGAAEAVQSLELMEGAPVFCGDGPQFACYIYIITVTGDKVEVISDAGELVRFLGIVDTAPEAALVAMANNYYFADGWIREDATSYKVLATSLEKGAPWECTPGSIKLTTFQVLLDISEHGRVDVVARKHLEDRCVDF